MFYGLKPEKNAFIRLDSHQSRTGLPKKRNPLTYYKIHLYIAKTN